MLPKLKEKYDFKKALKPLLNPSTDKPQIVSVPSMQFLAMEGMGSPNNNPVFEAAVSALYGCAYSIKFGRKKAGVEPEYSVQPLEGLWWVEGTDPADYLQTPQSEWHWKLLIGQPDFVTTADLQTAQAELLQKKGLDASAVQLTRWEEGLVVQILYIGPYKDEHPTISRMHAWTHEHGYTLHGLHHEIYLGDPRKTAPDKLKTILRQPVKI
ncbi:MAG: GyrI-like domain-containing protein [Saprospiraceae bacterium]|nr:GyrI-like domain-containing protein [Saprospiraceae bacterium]